MAQKHLALPPLFTALLKAPRRHSHEPTSPSSGFTLIELLVVMLIAGGIVSGLLYLAVELLTADQRESSRTETQQEMQMALDYMSTELRQAVYVYDQNCMSATPQGTLGSEDYCPGLYNHIPASMTPTNNNYPILAFWKQQQLPSSFRQACDDDAVLEEERAVCVSGNSYALIVYALETSNSATWNGEARIRRYSLTQFQTTDTAPGYVATAGYVDPGAFQHQFRTWPWYPDADGGVPENQQAAVPAGNPQVLVDFVDDQVRPGFTASCPTDYSFTSNATIPTTVANSFFGCVRNLPNDAESGQNRDTIVFLRGNPSGRPGIRDISDVSYLPTLETQVLSRPVLDKAPVE